MIKFNVHKFLSTLWSFGARAQASDIYFFPSQNRYLVKIRSINKLIDYRRISISEGQQCINYCKFYGGMNLSEHRRPQLGTISLNKRYSLRLSTVGDYQNHESMVIRLIKGLSDQNVNFLIPKQFKRLTTLSRRRGLILFVGPTGSGKTTSIYQLADQMSSQKMVMTIEDPVEIIKDNFLQLQINLKAGMDYQELLQLKVNEHYLHQCINSIVYQRLLRITSNQAGALLNIVTKDQLWNSKSEFDLVVNWRKNLSELVKKQKLMRQLIGNSNSVKLSIKEQIILFTSVKDFLKNGFNLKEAFDFCSLIHPELKAQINLIKRHLAKGKKLCRGT